MKMMQRFTKGKLRIFFSALLVMLILAFVGCGSKQSDTDTDTEVSIDDTDVFADDLMPLDEEELAALENPDYNDDEFSVADEPDEDSEEYEVEEEEEETAESTVEPGIDLEDGYSEWVQVEEDGTYTSTDEVAAYIFQFGHLPSNYITKSEAKKLGWVSTEGNLNEVAPGKSIGGDKYGNYEKMLPEEEGRTYYECDVNYVSGTRGAERLIYSDDGLIFYTGDHYETFQQLY